MHGTAVVTRLRRQICESRRKHNSVARTRASIITVATAAARPEAGERLYVSFVTLHDRSSPAAPRSRRPVGRQAAAFVVTVRRRSMSPQICREKLSTASKHQHQIQQQVATYK